MAVAANEPEPAAACGFLCSFAISILVVATLRRSNSFQKYHPGWTSESTEKRMRAGFDQLSMPGRWRTVREE